MKAYRNKYHEDKDQYEVLRELWSETSTVTLFRSKMALRSWIVTNTFNNGDVLVNCFTDEKEAWQTYYGRCHGALDRDEMVWEDTSEAAV